MAENRNDEVFIKVADKSKCKCARCIYGLFGGWANWKCLKYKDGKPNEVLYENKDCPKFVERSDKNFDNFKKK